MTDNAVEAPAISEGHDILPMIYSMCAKIYQRMSSDEANFRTLINQLTSQNLSSSQSLFNLSETHRQIIESIGRDVGAAVGAIEGYAEALKIETVELRKDKELLSEELRAVSGYLRMQSSNHSTELGRLNSDISSLRRTVSDLSAESAVRAVEIRELIAVNNSLTKNLSRSTGQIASLRESLDVVAKGRLLSDVAPSENLELQPITSNDGEHDDLELQERAIAESGLFDAKWYVSRYGSLLAPDERPARHYLTKGFRLSLSPSPLFDNDQYLEANRDVRDAGVNPLFHYWKYGRFDGRVVFPLGVDYDRS